MNTSDVAAWLQGLRLKRYVHALRKNEINAEILSKPTADDLKEIGVTTVGHRRKLLEAIAALEWAGQAAPREAPNAVGVAPNAGLARPNVVI